MDDQHLLRRSPVQLRRLANSLDNQRLPRGLPINHLLAQQRGDGSFNLLPGENDQLSLQR